MKAMHELGIRRKAIRYHSLLLAILGLALITAVLSSITTGSAHGQAKADSVVNGWESWETFTSTKGSVLR